MTYLEPALLLQYKTVLYTRYKSSALMYLNDGGGFRDFATIDGKLPKTVHCLPKMDCLDPKRKHGAVDNARCLYCGRYKHLVCLMVMTPEDEVFSECVPHATKPIGPHSGYAKIVTKSGQQSTI